MAYRWQVTGESRLSGLPVVFVFDSVTGLGASEHSTDAMIERIGRPLDHTEARQIVSILTATERPRDY